MKKIMIIVISICALIFCLGVVYAVTTSFNKELIIDKDLISNEKMVIPKFSYTEKEFKDGSIKVCVLTEKLISNRVSIKIMIPIGCKTINNIKLVDDTETQIIESYLIQQKKKIEYKNPEIIKETKGGIILKS